jgi:putative hydroxymethylpyrimidine transport system ATP-binding protein
MAMNTKGEKKPMHTLNNAALGSDAPVGSAGSGAESLLLEVKELTFGYEAGKTLLDGVDFHIRKGEFVSLLAPSGAGKSTVFRLIAGILEPQGGSISLHTQKGDSKASRLGQVGYMPQKDCLMPWRTVMDNAVLGLELQGISRKAASARVSDMMPAFGLAGTEKKYPHELSGGMRQRVSFLRSVVSGTEVMLLDEPFSALDAMTRVDMQEWLLSIWEQYRCAILFITHDIDEALLLSDRVLVATEVPIRQLSEVRIDLPRPRSYSDTVGERFAQRKRQVLEMLHRGQSSTTNASRSTGPGRTTSPEGGDGK